MTMIDTITDIVRRELAANGSTSLQDIRPEHRLRADLELSDLDLILIELEIDEQFKPHTPVAWEHIETIDDLAEYISLTRRDRREEANDLAA